MFGWCCQDNYENNSEVFVYRGSVEKSTRQTITLGALNGLIKNQDQQYRTFATSKYEQHIQKCQKKQQEFIDYDFQRNNQLFEKFIGRKIDWKRLKNIAKGSLFKEQNIKYIFDVKKQDSYFLSSLRALCAQPATILQVFDGQNYINQQGIYKMNICLDGQPKQMVIDDYLPVYLNNQERLVCSKAVDGLYWVLLFEKLYAKIQGGFHMISNGCPHQIFNIFTIAPALYHIIQLNFGQKEQQKIWIFIKQAINNKFPIVSGSRKRYTCKGIRPGCTYPIVDYQTSITNNQTRHMVKLINNYGTNQYKNEYTCVSYGNNGQFIIIDIVQFMRNFQLIDIAHIRPLFNSHFYSFKTGPSSNTFYFTEITQSEEFYITFQKQSKKGRIRLILCRVLQGKDSSYQYIDGKIQSQFNDATLHCKDLPKGKYVVLCQSSIENQCFLRIYCKSPLVFQPHKQQKKSFFEFMAYDLALKNQKDSIILIKDSKDWCNSKVMIEQIGLAFIVISLSETSHIKCQIQYNTQLLKKEGYEVLNKSTPNHKCQLVNSQIQILVLEYNGTSKDTIQFPPNNIKIRMII